MNTENYPIDKMIEMMVIAQLEKSKKEMKTNYENDFDFLVNDVKEELSFNGVYTIEKVYGENIHKICFEFVEKSKEMTGEVKTFTPEQWKRIYEQLTYDFSEFGSLEHAIKSIVSKTK